MAAVLNLVNLVSGDNPAEYCRLPVIIGANQCSSRIVQFHSWIIQGIGDSILRQLWANCTNDHSLWPSALNNETANHHVLARLDRGAGRDVGDVGRRYRDLKREVLIRSDSPRPYVGARCCA